MTETLKAPKTIKEETLKNMRTAVTKLYSKEVSDAVMDEIEASPISHVLNDAANKACLAGEVQADVIMSDAASRVLSGVFAALIGCNDETIGRFLTGE